MVDLLNVVKCLIDTIVSRNYDVFMSQKVILRYENFKIQIAWLTIISQHAFKNDNLLKMINDLCCDKLTVCCDQFTVCCHQLTVCCEHLAVFCGRFTKRQFSMK